MKKILILSVLLAIFSIVKAQNEISNVRVQVVDTVVIVTYDLEIKADIEVFISLNNDGNFMLLKEVEGEVGKDIMPKKNKIIIWNVVKELGYIDFPNAVIKVAVAEKTLVITEKNIEENLKREVLFSMGENEQIVCNEYYLQQKFEKNRFACKIYDELKEEYTFVFNGKRVETKSRIYVQYINLNEDNGYVFSYDRQESTEDINIKGTVYKNIIYNYDFGTNYENFRGITEEDTGYYIYNNGLKDGPFDNIELDNNYDYRYLLAGKWWGYKNGEKKLISEIQNFTYEKGGKYYVTIKNKPSPAYDFVYNLRLTESGKYAYIYQNDKKWYVNINGISSPAYYGIKKLYLTESGKYAYMYTNNEKYYVNINGEKKAENVQDLVLYNDGQYAYRYDSFEINVNGETCPRLHYIDNYVGYFESDWFLLSQNGYCYYDVSHSGKGIKVYVIINGNESSEYDYADNFQYTKNGFAYRYKKNGKWYVNIDEKSSPGYDSIYYWVDKSGDKSRFAYKYKDNGKWYVNINDKISSGYDEVNSLYLRGNKTYYHYKNNGKYYININDKPSAGYDEISLLRITESELAYKYKDNGKYYVNINGKSSSEYEDVGNFENSTKGYCYFYKNKGKWYANIYGKLSPAYDDVKNLQLTESGKYMYSYENDGKYYVNVNGKIYGAYYAAGWLSSGFFISDDDEYFEFGYILQGKEYKKSSEEEQFVGLVSWMNCSYGENADNIEFYSTDKKHLFYSGLQYVVIDGNFYGKSAALQAWYDETKNAFIWNAIEGKELVVYEYKLNN